MFSRCLHATVYYPCGIVVINKAYKSLEDEQQRQRALEVIEEAKGRTDMMVEEKRKKLRKAGKGDKVEEDDPEKESRENRVSSWKNFQTGKKSKAYKPPKHRAETR
ncbi:hypothetical protein HPB49_019100 [Dermacentor silvarum]|uniref:Uncharacterized protein n=1 Tax=Dermacentor silvarum TaxID=543639 RepID=A0ACB8CAP7_DERSI|nr:hypothetical protein HPB49_019100 [Dermacentor silvarum]